MIIASFQTSDTIRKADTIVRRATLCYGYSHSSFCLSQFSIVSSFSRSVRQPKDQGRTKIQSSSFEMSTLERKFHNAHPVFTIQVSWYTGRTKSDIPYVALYLYIQVLRTRIYVAEQMSHYPESMDNGGVYIHTNTQVVNGCGKLFFI